MITCSLPLISPPKPHHVKIHTSFTPTSIRSSSLPLHLSSPSCQSQPHLTMSTRSLLYCPLSPTYRSLSLLTSIAHRFNAPRNRPPGSSSSAFSSSPVSAAKSSYDPLAFASPSDPDPWAASPSLSASTPAFPSTTPSYSSALTSSAGPSAFSFASSPATSTAPPPPPTSGFGTSTLNQPNGLVDQDRLSPIYLLALEAIDPFGKGEGGLSIVQLNRVVKCSGLGPSVVEAVCVALARPINLACLILSFPPFYVLIEPWHCGFGSFSTDHQHRHDWQGSPLAR